MPCVLFGGSFDPVHYGHLRMAVEVGELLQAEVRLLPSPAQAGKRNRATAQQRVDMLQLALAEANALKQPPLRADRSEVDLRSADDLRPVYTIDTLSRYRQQLPQEQPLIFVMGMDSFLNIRDWHQWSQLTRHAHLLVIGRPGSQDEAGSAALAELRQLDEFSGAFVEEPGVLLERPAGHIHLVQLSLLDISSTRIRALISRGRPASYLTAPAVLDYIARNDLYSCAADHNLI
ncbi:nicotinate (nicotinamide) nucleotide adenylyltransferase [Allohahella marinimesophila]|uniref:Probable nicotinate-nucleotide adenylyltransferase n=1 Tax=Allohahella marinimesophila TaxID=1054972 RepID=A0ABP7NF88_9GAMM